ncbi:MAG TPA: MFS transporter [Burkholderiales bacterium]|nr:MFS transporter [Burkholderiales bacterium]
MASAFAYRDFRWLWTSSLLSWSGQWIQQAALGWVVYEITGSGALLGAVMGARAAPMFLLAPLSGVAAERWDGGGFSREARSSPRRCRSRSARRSRSAS